MLRAIILLICIIALVIAVFGLVFVLILAFPDFIRALEDAKEELEEFKNRKGK